MRGMGLAAILDFNEKTLDTSVMTSLLSPVLAVHSVNAWESDGENIHIFWLNDLDLDLAVGLLDFQR